MIFICRECGNKYDTKPDFCDCGNDSFDEVYETTPIEKTSKKIKLKTNDIFSWSIFGICIVLSILVLAFFPKISEKPVKAENTTKQQTKIVRETNPNIPDIDTFWINTPVKEEPQTTVEQIKELFNPKPQPTPVAKKPQSAAQQKQAPKTVQKPKMTQTQTQTQKPKTQQSKPQQQTTQNNTTQNNNNDVFNPYEWMTYKNALGNRLLANLNVSEIEGGGKCIVAFAIDSTGKLISRNFVLQSDNKTLNDEVYKMLMRTPRYNPPPSSYNGQTLRFVIELHNNTLRAYYN